MSLAFQQLLLLFWSTARCFPGAARPWRCQSLALFHSLALGCFMLLGAGTALGAQPPAPGALVVPGVSPVAPSGGVAEEPAPMCDPNGASVAAREEVPEIDRGHFEALPCEAQLLLSGWRLDALELGCRAMASGEREPPAPLPSLAPRMRQDAVGEHGISFPARAEPALMVLSVREGLAPRRGHGRPLFRPPVARA